MADAHATPAITDPQRTTAVYAIREQITELTDAFCDAVDEHRLHDARGHLIGISQQLDALVVLGPPSRALHQLLGDCP